MAGVNPSNWYVVGQQETNRTDPTGRFVSGMLVSFQTKEGLSGSVFVPHTNYTPEQVKALIQARYVQMTSVQQLSG